MKWVEWSKFAMYAFAFIVGTAIPFIIAVANAHKKRKNAKNEAEKAQADAELLSLARTLIANVEKEYKDYNNFLKTRGQSAGSVKKASVLTDLKAYAIEKGYSFLEDEWDKKIDELVEFTRSVNAK